MRVAVMVAVRVALDDGSECARRPVERSFTLSEFENGLAESSSGLVESTSDLVESTSDLVESTSDLVESTK